MHIHQYGTNRHVADLLGADSSCVSIATHTHTHHTPYHVLPYHTHEQCYCFRVFTLIGKLITTLFETSLAHFHLEQNRFSQIDLDPTHLAKGVETFKTSLALAQLTQWQ